MATAEEISLAVDDMIYLTGVHRSILCNALEYHRLLAMGTPEDKVASIAKANVEQYKLLLATRSKVRVDSPDNLNAGLEAVGVDVASHDALLASIESYVASEDARKPSDAKGVRDLATAALQALSLQVG